MPQSEETCRLSVGFEFTKASAVQKSLKPPPLSDSLSGSMQLNLLHSKHAALVRRSATWRLILTTVSKGSRSPWQPVAPSPAARLWLWFRFTWGSHGNLQSSSDWVWLAVSSISSEKSGSWSSCLDGQISYRGCIKNSSIRHALLFLGPQCSFFSAVQPDLFLYYTIPPAVHSQRIKYVILSNAVFTFFLFR